MKSIIEREATLENNSDMEVKVTQKKYHSPELPTFSTPEIHRDMDH